MKHHKYIGLLLPACLLLASIAAAYIVKRQAYEQIAQDEIILLVNQLTDGYQLRQVVAAVLAYLTGYLAVPLFLPKVNVVLRSAAAMPVAVALFGAEGCILLLIGVPFCFGTAAVFYFGVLAVLFYWRRKEIRFREMASLRVAGVLFCVAAFAVFASSGILPVFMSSDSYYYVMQYGEIIAHTGALQFGTAGTFMTWTGLTSALMSALAVFCGFETIQVFHWMLVGSVWLGVVYVSWRELYGLFGRKSAAVAAVGIGAFMPFVPPFTLLAVWVISNTYFMVYLFFFCVLAQQLAQDADAADGGWMLLSVFAVWMAFSRIEASLVVSFLIVCVSSLDISRKHLMLLSFPVSGMQIAYMAKVLYEQSVSVKKTAGSMLDYRTAGVMAAAVVLLAGYSALSERAWVLKLRSRLNAVIMAALVFGCILLGMLYPDRFLANSRVVAWNLSHEYGLGCFLGIVFFCLLAAFVAKWKLIQNSGRCMHRCLCNAVLEWQDVAVAGYVLFNFAVCIGRQHALRQGFGDSYYRILCSIAPLAIYVTVRKIVQIAKIGREQEWAGTGVN